MAPDKKQYVFKTVFDSPLSQWPLPCTEEGAVAKVLGLLAPLAAQHGLARRKAPAPASEPLPKRKRVTEDSTGPRLLVGLNEVTRMLDRAARQTPAGESGSRAAALVIACPDAAPCPQLLQHVPVQCRIAGVPLLVIDAKVCGGGAGVARTLFGADARPVMLLAVVGARPADAVVRAALPLCAEERDSAGLYAFRALAAAQVRTERGPSKAEKRRRKSAAKPSA